MCLSTELVLRLNVGYVGTLVRLLRHECLVRFIRKLLGEFDFRTISLFLELFRYCIIFVFFYSALFKAICLHVRSM